MVTILRRQKSIHIFHLFGWDAGAALIEERGGRGNARYRRPPVRKAGTRHPGSEFWKTGSPEVREILAACAGASFMLS